MEIFFLRSCRCSFDRELCHETCIALKPCNLKFLTENMAQVESPNSRFQPIRVGNTHNYQCVQATKYSITAILFKLHQNSSGQSSKLTLENDEMFLIELLYRTSKLESGLSGVVFSYS